MTDADVEQSEAGGFIEDDFVVGAAAWLLAGDDIANVGHDIARAEPAVRKERIERLAWRIITEHLLRRGQIDARSQHRSLVELARSERHDQRARREPIG